MRKNRNDPNPREKTLKCEMCGGSLPRFSKGSLCGTACRKAKSRLKSDVGKNAIDARNSIRKLIMALDLDLVHTRDIGDEYNEIQGLMSDLYRAYDERWKRIYNPEPKGFTRDDSYCEDHGDEKEQN